MQPSVCTFDDPTHFSKDATVRETVPCDERDVGQRRAIGYRLAARLVEATGRRWP